MKQNGIVLIFALLLVCSLRGQKSGAPAGNLAPGVSLAPVVNLAPIANPDDRESQANVCLLSDPFLLPALVADGEDIASKIFDGIGVRLQWKCDDTATELEGQSRDIVIRVQDETPQAFLAGALAYSLPFAHRGVRITVFYDRLKPILDRYFDSKGSLLGHTMAHEIAHILAGQDAHASSGLMQARWTDRDFEFMRRRHLLGFTPEDARFIRQNLSLRKR